ncbi:DUF4838 domain-containing protein [Paenibacillus cymbidii]|uniref:DUF4838 domain-containing protein n=1 Tax=Paenibacillus cymbidii TaxID=1639034 RepID=UPI0014369DB1|nr:DUF4838 domain-containing protein [Paenibacillus cymbidii]
MKRWLQERRNSVLIWLSYCLLVAGAAGAAWISAPPVSADSDVSIVASGAPQAIIVTSAVYGDARTNDAAQLLAAYVEKSTTAVLPVMTDAQLSVSGSVYDGMKRIYVGWNGEPGDTDVPALVAALDDDGFLIRAAADHLTIMGPTAWGTQFGVYDFLERFVGVSWLMPTEVGEDVPAHSSLLIPIGDVSDEPAFFHRVFSPMYDPAKATGPTGYEWATRNKMHWRISFHHNLWSLFPYSVYGSTYPEIYPAAGTGAWTSVSSGKLTSWQPCFSEPITITIAANQIIQYFNDHPEETSFSLGVNDSSGFCEANPSHPNYPGTFNSLGKVNMSDIYYNWVNEVVELVLAVHPDKYFGLLAYYEVQDPPSFPLNSHVVPFLTKDRMAWIDEDVREEGEQMTADWSLKAERIGWYDYIYGSFYPIPRIYMNRMAENYQYAADHNVAALYSELYPSWGEGPKPWVSAKLQWNPDQSATDLENEWYEKAVGPLAAPVLKQYYDHWEDFWTNRIVGSPWFETEKVLTYLRPPQEYYMRLTTDQDVADSRAWLEQTLALTQTPEEAARAQVLLDAFEYYEASVLSYPKPAGTIANASDAAAMLNEVFDMQDTRLSENVRHFQLIDDYSTDPLLKMTIDPRVKGLLWSSWEAERLFKLADYLRANEPSGGPIKTMVQLLVDFADSANIRSYMSLLLQAAYGASSATNGSYETQGTTATSAPSGWSFWNKTAAIGNFQRTTTEARTGSASVMATGITRGGPQQTFAVQPGLFAARVFFKAPNLNTQSTLQLSFNLLDANKAPTSGQILSELNTLRFYGGGWASLDIMDTIPETYAGKQVKYATIIPTLTGLELTEKVYLDDVVFYQPPAASQITMSNDRYWGLVDYLAANEPTGGPVTELVDKLSEGSADESMRTDMAMVLNGAAGQSLALNPSFESGTNPATNWLYYNKYADGTIGRSASDARTGSASLQVQGVTRGGPLQGYAVSSGAFAARMWIKLPTGVAPSGNVQLRLNLMNAQNDPLPTYIATPTVNISSFAAGQWVPVSIKSTIPAEVNGVAVKRVQIIGVVNNLQATTNVFLDDLVMYQAP